MKRGIAGLKFLIQNVFCMGDNEGFYSIARFDNINKARLEKSVDRSIGRTYSPICATGFQCFHLSSVKNKMRTCQRQAFTVKLAPGLVEL